MAKITISKGNSKMGAIPSVSLPPIVTCAPGCPCAKDCYAVKLCRIYKNVKASYQRNLDAWQENPIAYFHEVDKTLEKVKYFRFHVSGDIPDIMYFKMMIYSAKKYPNCHILVFTKKYSIINEFIRNSAFGTARAIPENLHIIFSAWDGMTMQNPYNLPTSTVIFKDTVIDTTWKICGGNCTECAERGEGCWTLRHGETVAFYKH